jgi:hypothetical protein
VFALGTAFDEGDQVMMIARLADTINVQIAPALGKVLKPQFQSLSHAAPVAAGLAEFKTAASCPIMGIFVQHPEPVAPLCGASRARRARGRSSLYHRPDDSRTKHPPNMMLACGASKLALGAGCLGYGGPWAGPRV